MLEFVKYDKNFLVKSWDWLNDKEIKEMTATPDFTRSEQLIWFKQLEYKNNYYIRGIKYNNVEIGVVGLKNIENSIGEYWGYIGEKEYWGKKIGEKMLEYIEAYSKKINLEKIYLKVLKNNSRANNLYRKKGFTLIKNENIFEIYEKKIKYYEEENV